MQRFQISKQSWRKRSMSAADIAGELPLYNPTSAAGRRESQSWSTRSIVKYNRVHLIPLVVMLCFFILWCFSSPVELETKDGRTTFVPITKKPPKESEATDVDLTVLALESPPDSNFLSISDGPYPSSALHNQPDLSFLASHNHNEPLTDPHKPNPSSSISHDLKAPLSVSHQPSATFSDSHKPNKLLSSDSHNPNAPFLVSHESRISYPGTSNEAAPKARGESS